MDATSIGKDRLSRDYRAVVAILPPLGRGMARGCSSSVIGVLPSCLRRREGPGCGKRGLSVGWSMLSVCHISMGIGLAETLQSPLEVRLPRLRYRQVASPLALSASTSRLTKRLRLVVDERISAADELAMLAAHGARHQCAIAQVNSSMPFFISITSGPLTNRLGSGAIRGEGAGDQLMYRHGHADAAADQSRRWMTLRRAAPLDDRVHDTARALLRGFIPGGERGGSIRISTS